MAILKNVVMRGASQRLGGIVLYTRSGETIARELAPSVSNPRTRIQMQQRVKLANVVAMYKANKFWMPGAFEDKAEKETDYNAFVRFNLTDSKVALTKDAAAAGAGVVAPYKISSGSLGEIELTGSQTGVQTNLYTGALIITSVTTVGQLSAALETNNNGITKGMQLSIIVNLQRRNEITSRPYIVVRAYEIIIDETSTKLVSEFIPHGLLETLDLEGRPLFFNGSSLGDGAAAFILSKTEGGKTAVSTQTLRFYGNQSIYSIYTSATAVESAIRSYGSNETRFLDSSEAAEYNPVVLENYIQAMEYDSTLYTNGQEISGILAYREADYIYFAQPISGTPSVELFIGDDTNPVAITEFSLNPAKSRLRFIIPSGHEVSEATDCTIAVTYDEITLEFNFIALP